MNILKFLLKYKIVISIVLIGLCTSTTFLIVKTKNKETSTSYLQENLIKDINFGEKQDELNVVQTNEIINAEEIENKSEVKNDSSAKKVQTENIKTNISTPSTTDTTQKPDNNKIQLNEDFSTNTSKNEQENEQENEKENVEEDTNNYQQAMSELQEAKKAYDNEVTEINNWYNSQAIPIKEKIEEYNNTLSILGGTATSEQVEGAIQQLNFAKENAAFNGLSYSGPGAEMVKQAEENLMNVNRRYAITEELKSLNAQLNNLNIQKQEKLNYAFSTYKQRKSEIKLKYGL